MTFDDLKFNPRDSIGGVHALAFFDNGYGVSVVRGFGTYGGESGLYELAVLKGDSSTWDLCYDTEVTSDVEGYLTESAVTRLIGQVETL